MALPLGWHLRDRTPGAASATIEVRTGDEPLTIEIAGGGVHSRPGPAADPDLVVSGAPELVIGVLLGWLEAASARSRGLKITGDASVLRRLSRESPRPVPSKGG